MARVNTDTVQTVTRSDPMLTRGGKVPVSGNTGTIRPPSGGSRPATSNAGSNQSSSAGQPHRG